MIKVIIGTSIVPTTIFIILFVELGILVTSFPQFVYAQTAENEIIENALESVEKATTQGLSEIKESVSNASKATDSTNTSDRFILQNQSEFKDSTRNWINGESDKLSFKYPSNWDVNVSDSRFDNYEFIFTDKTSKSSIRVSDEAIKTTNKIFLTANNSQGYFDIYMMQNSPLPSTAQKIETYPKGKVTIAGLPSYSELYIDNEYANLISLAFQKGNDRHYIVLSRSPSSNYDNLEPTIIEIIKSITPKTMQKPSTGEVEIFSNNSDSVDLSNNQDAKQLKKEDHVERESLLSNLTESNNYTSNESIIKQENGSLTQKSNIYEGLGIKIKYFDPWTIVERPDEPNCSNICVISLHGAMKGGNKEDFANIVIVQNVLNGPKIKDECKCDTLLEYVKYEYENDISKHDDFVFINDNQTTLTKDNKSAIQLEYEFSSFWLEQKVSTNKVLTIFTKDNNSFYNFIIYVNMKEHYSKYVNDFKKMIDSLQFVSSNESKQKQPSFMIAENTTESNILQKEKTSMSAKEPNEGLTTEELVNETIALKNETMNETIIGQEKQEQIGGSTLEEQLKLAQEKLNQFGLGSYDQALRDSGYIHIINRD